MFSSVKQRKQSVQDTNHQLLSANYSDDNSNSEKNSAKYGTSSSLVVYAAFPKILLVSALMLLLCASIHHYQSTSRTNKRLLLQQEEGGSLALLPFSTLLPELDHQPNSQFGQIPLTGQYSLGVEHQLQTNFDSSTNEESGEIYFPYKDLSIVLEDVAIKREYRQEPKPSRQQTGTYFANEQFHQSSQDPIHSILVPFDERKIMNNNQALLTLRGIKGNDVPNQDRSFIARFFFGTLSINDTDTSSNSKTLNNNTKSQEALLMGIFDGHGDRGHEISQFIALELPRTFAKFMRQQENSLESNTFTMYPQRDTFIRQAFVSTFLELDAKEPVKGAGGSTVSTIFYPGMGSKLYLANVGDSIAIIAHYSKLSEQSTIVKKNRIDKPHMLEERQRIEAAGGKVYTPYSLLGDSSFGPKESSRLMITLGDGSRLFLAMSRSIGDVDGKPFGLISEPNVEVLDVQQYYTENNFSMIEINDSQWFGVIASDGMLDFIPTDLVVQQLGWSLYKNSDLNSPLEVCENLIQQASHLWMNADGPNLYRDDITLGVSKIRIET